MANKRSLKRSITLICEELLVECVASSLYGPNRDNAEALIFSIVKMQDDFLPLFEAFDKAGLSGRKVAAFASGDAAPAAAEEAPVDSEG